MRRYKDCYDPNARYRLRPGAYAILHLDGMLLLTHQQEPNPEVQLPGGGIDPGENPARALRREVMEETGWRITDIRRFGVYRRFTFMPEYKVFAEKVCHIFTARPVRAISDPVEDGHTALWAHPRTAVDIIEALPDRDMVRRWMGGRR